LPYWPTPPSNVSIHHNSIHHCSGAIEFRGVNGASIANNTITNNATAVGLYGAVGDPSITNRNISILGNTISQNTGKGIFGDGYNAPSPGVITVSGNTFSNNTDDGVYFQYNIRFVIDGNEISGSKRGIRLYNSSDNSIENNYIHGNSEYGVLIRGNSDRNKCLSNRISSNPVGIRNEPWGADTPENNEAHSNNISGNTNFGVSNGATGLFDATNNWWGDASGPLDTTGTNEVPPCTADPTTEKNADGSGDKVSDNVDYCPWATAPF
jgi:parallel beta-helix repeat protein